MKKIVNNLTSFLNKLIVNNAADKPSNLQVQPLYTQSSASYTKTITKSRSISFIAGVFVLLVICTSLSSCFTSGYGCKGKSHCMTRVS